MDFAFLYSLQHLHRPWLDGWMTIITHLGDGGGIWIFCAFLLGVKKETRKIAMILVVGLLLDLVLGNLILKNIVGRPRPCDLDPHITLLISRPFGHSFPSGHTLSSFTSATILYDFRKTWGRWAFLLASVIAFSRMYHFVHYPTDVLAGVILGYLIGKGAIKVVEVGMKKEGEWHDQ